MLTIINTYIHHFNTIIVIVLEEREYFARQQHTAYLVVTMDEFLSHVMKYKIIENIYNPFGEKICRAKDSFSSVSRLSINTIHFPRSICDPEFN